MRWEIKPFVVSLIPANNKSSRSVDKSVPNNGMLSLTGSLAFGSKVLDVVHHKWVTFTNTGIKQLKNIELILPKDFEYYGTVPTVLDIGDHFIIRLSYNPTKIGPRTGKIYVKAFKVVFEFHFSATVSLGNFTYNDMALYDGVQAYDGELNV